MQSTNRLGHLHFRFSISVLLFLATFVVATEAAQPGNEPSGYAVALDNDVAVVGTPWQDAYAGSAHVLRQVGDEWVIAQTLFVDEIERYDHFGGSVAFANGYIAVSAPWHDLLRGAVYVFKSDGQTWQLHQKLVASDAAPDNRFGATAIFDGDVLVVTSGNQGNRAAYRFELAGGQWEERGRDVVRERSTVSTPSATKVIESAGTLFDLPPAYASAVNDSLEWVTASDAVFESRVEIKWSVVELDAIIYKILRNGTLISVASSQDSVYNDTSGHRGVTYDYCVVVQDMYGGEGTPKCDTGSRVIRAPAHLVASDGQFTDGVRLTWEDRSSVEKGFYVRRNGGLIATTNRNIHYYVDVTALPLTEYSYEVVAFDDIGDESNPDTDTGFRGVVLPPLEVAATDGEYASSVRVTWIDQSDETGFIITRLNLTSMDSTVLDTTAMDIQDYFDNTAQFGVRYQYCVFALDGIGQLSVPGCDEGGIDLAAPINVAASDSTFDDRVQIKWEEESGLADGYYIWRDGALIDSVGAAVRVYNDFNTSADTTHTYCVVTFNDNGGKSGPGCDDGFQMIIMAPTDVQASDGTYEDRTEIKWNSSSTTVVLFKIFRDGVFIKSVGEGARLFADDGGAAGVEYVYSIQAVTALLESSTTTNDTGRRELKVPINVAATDNAFEDRVEISWRDLSSIETGYVIYRTEDGSSVVDSIGETGPGTTSFVDRMGVPGITYLYQVAAFDIDGEHRGESKLSKEDEGIRTLRRPDRVDAGDGEFEDRVEITWTDESNAEDGYRLYRNGVLVVTTGDNVTSAFDVGPPLGQNSEYSVRAFDHAGMSEADDDFGSTALLAPASLNASDFYDDIIELRWVDVSEVEEGYTLNVDSMGVNLRTIKLPAGATSFTDFNAIPSVRYDYRLHAYAGAAVSDEVEDSGIIPVEDVATETTQLSIQLKAADADPGDRFGESVSIDGRRLIVGARTDDNGTYDTGAAYIFSENPDGTWSQEAKFPGDAFSFSYFIWSYRIGQEFGSSVAIAGDRAIVGAPKEFAMSNIFTSVERQGYVAFLRADETGTWRKDGGNIFASGPGADMNSNFGNAVAIERDRAVVGQYHADDGAVNSGAAYVFQDVGDGWKQQFRFKASDADPSDFFGSSVAMSGALVVVGAPGDDEEAVDAGAAYVCKLHYDLATGSVDSVSVEAKLTARTNAASGDNFGRSVGISGNLIVVGIGQAGNACAGKAPGAAYVFRYDAGSNTWLEEARLTASDGSQCDLFGNPVAINGQRVVVGTGGGVDPYIQPGTAYIFDRESNGAWTEKGKLSAQDGAPIGGGVGISSDRLIVGAPLDAGASNSEGSAYILNLVSSPGDVVASDGTTEGFVHIQWKDRSDNEEGFAIYRDGVNHATVGSDIEFYDDLQAEPGRTYEYAVSGINGTLDFESERVSDLGWRPPDGNLTGRVTARDGTGVENVSVCLEPPPTRALLLDGAGGHVRIPDDGAFNFLPAEDFTVEVWFSYAGTDRSPRLISKLTPNATNVRPLDLGLQRNGRLYFVMSDGENVARVLSQRNDLGDDRWHHVACVHNAYTQTLTLIIDGVEEDNVSTTGLGQVTNESDVFIGGIQENTWFGGQIDELRIWNTPRTLAELSATMTMPLMGDEEGLIGYWPFDAFSGETVTDFAGSAQYGFFVGGVYRTTEVAPLDVCGRTDRDGNFTLSNIRYAENGTDFRLRPSLGERQFSPAVQTVTLNRGHPVENQVVFADVSSHVVSGVVQFAGTQCFEPDVEIRVDNAPSAVTDKNGKFSVAVTHGTHTFRARYRDYDFHVAFDGSTVAADSITVDVLDNMKGLVFVNETRLPMMGKVGGGCDRYVGEITIRYRSENNCIDTTFVGNPGYAIDLPPLKYFASATIDRETIPESLVRPDVIEFFQNLGEREVNLVAESDTTKVDDTLDFIYRAPLRITIAGFEPYVDPGCPRLELEDGTLLPAGLPVIPQGTFVDLRILVEEDYGNEICPLDTGMVLVRDEIFDQENSPDTLFISNGEATYKTFASTPSLVRGRTEGLNDRSFQKALTVKTLVAGRAPKTETEWVLVTGHVAPEGAEFITIPMTDLPLYILRDPPGDGSYAYIEKGMTICNRLRWTDWTISGGIGVAWEFKGGATQDTWVGFGGGVSQVFMAHFQTTGKLVAGLRFSSSETVDLCVKTTERLSTSDEEDFIGGEADLYVGAGVTFLFSEVGVIETNGCVVEQTTSVGFEPDSIHTTFAFTERHITDILIPELESKIDYYTAHDDPDSVIIFEMIRDQWEYQVEYNRSDKLSREDTVVVGTLPLFPTEPPLTIIVPREVENRTFSAGGDYEYSRTSDRITTRTSQLAWFAKGEAVFGGRFGAKDKAEFLIGVALESDNSGLLPVGWDYYEETNNWQIGYVLGDNDFGDAFTVDIVRHSGGWGDIFDVLGGRSSCPYEPWLDLESGEPNMVRRDKPHLLIDPPQRWGIMPDATATFKLIIANLSDEGRDYVVRPVSNSNPGGAIMSLNGAPITDNPVFSIDGFGNGINSHEATLTVDRGPSRFAYERLALVVEPVCGGDIFGQAPQLNTIDSVFFDVYFEGCSAINMRGPDVVPGWTYNQADSAAGRKFDIVLDGYELVINRVTPNLLEAVGIQYRHMGVGREGPGPWVDIEEIPPGVDADISLDGSPDTIMVWQPDSLANGAYLPLEDGVYELRAYTVCSTGGRSFSSASMGTIDRHAPVVFGTPHPSDGELSLGEDIGITFNEPVDCSLIGDATITLKYVDGPRAGETIAVKPVCNGETIILVPQVDPVDLDGRRLEASVAGIVDLVGNAMSSTITWQFDYRKNLFTWSETRITQDVAIAAAGSVPAELVNGRAETVDYEITSVPSFLTVAPADASGRLAPGGKREIDFAIDPLIAGGIHQGQVTVQAVNEAGTDTVAVAVLEVVLDVSCAAPDWAINAGAFEYSMSIVSRVLTDDGDLTGEDDLVAAFVGEQLRGLASPRPVAGDTLVFLTVFSNRISGETVRFEVWDDDKCKRYGNTEERVPFVTEDVLGTTLAPMILTAVDALPGSLASFPLNAGWNWFSTNMVSPNMEVGSVLSSLAPTEGDVIKSKTTFAVFDPDTSIGWVGTLTTMDNTSGYMIKLTEAGTVLQEGTFADPTTTPVPVGNGWNWIGYVPTDVKSIGAALADLETQALLNGNEIVKSQTAFAEWNAGWFGSLEAMQPGMGYRLYLQDPALPATFNYAANVSAVFTVAAGRRPNLAGSLPITTEWTFNPNVFEHNMNVIAVVRGEGREWSGADKIVGAFVGGQCRGLVALMPITGIDYDIAFATIHSNEISGETVTFRALDSSAETVYKIKETVPFSANATSGTLRNPVVLTTTTSDGKLPTAYRLAQNHPNPFNPVTTIRFDLPQASHVVLRIYNVAGQTIRKLVDQEYSAGSHNVVWDGRTSSGGEASSGVYFYQIQAGSFVDVKRMVLLR